MFHLRMYRLIACLLAATCATVAFTSCSCRESKNAPPKSDSVRLVQEWLVTSNYAGAVLAKHKFAKSNDIDLAIIEGSEQIDPVLEVVQGRADFGDASADKILAANLKSADLVVIGTVSQYSPTCFIVKQGSGIRDPRDFVGKKVGVLFGTNTEKIYRMMLAKSGLPSTLPDEVPAPFDLTSFIEGQYDVRPAFIYDEPVTLKQRGVEYAIINPLDYGVKFVGTVYFCKRETVRTKPKVVQAFVNSVCEGWLLATRRPELAIELLKADWPMIDEKRELESLKQGIGCFVRADGRLLSSVDADWRQMVADLSTLGGENADLVKINLNSVINNSFVDSYYAKAEK